MTRMVKLVTKALLGKDLRNILGPATIRIVGILTAAVIVCCAATATSLLGQTSWPLELTIHFRVQYAFVLISAGVILLVLRRFRIAAVSLLFALPNLVLMAPLYFPDHSSSNVGPPVKAVFMNLLVTNREYEKAAECVRFHNPDIVAVAELNQAWLTNLKQRLPDYPHVVSRTREDQFGIGLFSKNPIMLSNILDLGILGYPSIRASIMAGGRRLTVFVLHPPAPIAEKLREDQVKQMKNLTPLVMKERDVVILGDLNTTEWSPLFRDLVGKAGLQDCRSGFGLHPTWPTTFPWLLIPIDHCLISNNLVVRRLTRGPAIGSDHYPLVLELGVR